MTTTIIDAMKSALEALEYSDKYWQGQSEIDLLGPAIDALNQAIEQYESAEPVARVMYNNDGSKTDNLIDCDLPVGTLLYTRPASNQYLLDVAFEDWWQKEGQFCRAGGGDYEKTFAFRAWEASARSTHPAPAVPESFIVDLGTGEVKKADTDSELREELAEAYRIGVAQAKTINKLEMLFRRDELREAARAVVEWNDAYEWNDLHERIDRLRKAL